MKDRKIGLRWIAVACLGLMAFAGCLPGPGQLPGRIDVADGLQAEYVMFNEPAPAAMAAADDGRVFYTERQTGRIRVIKDGVLLSEPFAEVPVNFAGERGLLGIAIHPRFAENGRVYVFYTRSDTGLTTNDPQAVVDHRIVYFEADEGADVAAAGERFVASLPVGSAASRIGGCIGFFDDQTLVIGLGDLTDTAAAQNEDVLSGKVLRYTDAGGIPEDNPDPNSPVYARGFRDPLALTFDPDTGVPFVLERSANGLYEINRVVGGRNYGWPSVAGVADSAAELGFVTENADYTDPILDTGARVITLQGLAFNPSGKYGTDSRWRLYYADALAGSVLGVRLNAERVAVLGTETLAARFPRPIRALTFTPAGTLYVASSNAILRVVTFP